MARRVRIETPADISLEESYPQERIWVEAVAWELSDAFWNVLNNAAKAMLQVGGGTLAVGVRTTADEEARTLVDVTIHNTGPKIPKDVLQRIFEPFRSNTGSIGYGLWRTQDVVQTLGGSISIDNDDNDLDFGVEARIRLPVEPLWHQESEEGGAT